MAAKTTTKKSTKSTKKTEDTQGLRSKVRNRAIDLQLRSLELQESAFDRTYDVLSSAQERSEERMEQWLEKSERVPAEAKHIVKEWIGFQQDARKGYRSAVAKSFDLSQKWFEGLRKSA